MYIHTYHCAYICAARSSCNKTYTIVYVRHIVYKDKNKYGNKYYWLLWLLYFISIYRLAIIPTFFLNLHCNAMNLYDLLHLFLLQNITKCRICTSIWIISIIRLLYYASPLMPQNFDLHAFRSAKHQCWITFEVSHTHKHFIHT